MQTKKITVQNEHGMHARVAMQVAEKSKTLSSEITIHKGSEKANSRSVLELLMLGAEQGAELEVVATGEDEENSIREISHIFSDGAGI